MFGEEQLPVVALIAVHNDIKDPIAALDQGRLDAALIPQINGLLAVGVVSLPGMMTGQILSGVDPMVAVRYQIMVMCMVFGSGGIAAAVYLQLRIGGRAAA